jgi:hypothetical protein
MKKNILAENMRRFGTKNLNELNTYVASTHGPLNPTEIKIYEHILHAIQDCVQNLPADEIDDFTDTNDKQYYLKEFKKIIDAIQALAKTIEAEMYRD